MKPIATPSPVTVASPVASSADHASQAAVAVASTAGLDVDFDRRFGGVARLYGRAGLANFRAARICVVGVGGVGSWIVEALARSAIGHLTLIDLDNLAESNVNRQIHALTDTLGMAKVTALARRVAQINPFCIVDEVEEMLDAASLDRLIGSQHFDYIVDAIDDVRAKTALIAYCRAGKLRLITIGGAGGQTDPTRIEVRDLCRTEQEPLLAKVRKRLRSEHGFPRGTKNKFGIEAVFSTEPLQAPFLDETACDTDLAVNAQAGGDALPGMPGMPGVTGLHCAGYGSAVVVTAAFGLVAAARVLRDLAACPTPVTAVRQ